MTNKTYSASSAIDASGGMHFGYSAYVVDSNGHRPAYYAYCSSDCGNAANWATVSLSDDINGVQLALTQAGHPRMLLRGDDPSYNTLYQYAACDISCTNPVNWTLTAVTISTYIDIYSWDRPQHYFALDHQDRPRFLYRKSGSSGIYYVFCDANCSSDTTWYEFQLFNDVLYDPTLLFTSSDQPRIAASNYTDTTSLGILQYIACDNNCSNLANWSLTPLIDTGGGTFVMRLDSNNNPRIALSKRPSAGAPMVLYYLWCDTDCTSDANWSGYDIGFEPGQTQDPDLALDASNHPRISYKDNSNNGLGYAWCDSGCETFSPTWQAVLAEPSSDLEAEWPILPPYNCSLSYWYGGYRSSLSLDPDGNPRIGYDAQHLYGGGCTVDEDYRTVRFLFFD
jgi:hypothetical protein